MSRPTKRTPENAKRILDLLRAGTTRKAAYTAARVSHETFADWIREDRDFADDVEAAEQEAIALNVALVQRAARGGQPVTKTVERYDQGKLVSKTTETATLEGDWRAAAWFLEKKDPKNYGRKLDVTTDGEKIPGTTVLIGLDKVDDHELDRRLAEAEGRKAPQAVPG